MLIPFLPSKLGLKHSYIPILQNKKYRIPRKKWSSGPNHRIFRHHFINVHNVGNCAISKVILIVLVLYFLVPPTGDYHDVITHVNPGEIIHKKRIKKNIFLLPLGRSTLVKLSSQYQ